MVVAEKLYTVEEYFDFCETHEGRYEFIDGEIIEMSGESTTANKIAGNIHFFFRVLLEDKPFEMYQNAVKLMVQGDKKYRIPDFQIIHESGNKVKYATEPILIVEVLSDSTANVDRHIKLAEYSGISSLQYYLIIDQDNCFVELFVRDGSRWYVEFYTELNESVKLPFFETQLPLSTIYKKIILAK